MPNQVFSNLNEIVLGWELARLTVYEGGIEGDQEADRGEKHLNRSNEVLFRQLLQRNIPLFMLNNAHSQPAAEIRNVVEVHTFACRAQFPVSCLNLCALYTSSAGP